MISLNALIDLIFPRMCPVCGDYQLSHNSYACISCKKDLFETDHFNIQPNEVHDRIEGKVPVWNAAALYRFQKGNPAQKIMHKIKYGGHGYLAVVLGRYLGLKLKHSDYFNQIDALIPIPLNRRKIAKRGFNQSELIARGISKETNIPNLSGVIKRRIHTTSQTGLTRWQRVENLKNAFQLTPYSKHKLQDKRNILLVDDVVTTGATIEACANTILEICPDARFSVIAICLAS